MAATQKAVAISRQLAETLALRTGLAAVQGVDASGNPTIALGTQSAGQQAAFVRVKQDYDPALELDGIGNVQRRFAPHVIQVVLETSTIANVALMTEANKAKLWKELESFGTKVELYMTANTVAVSVSGITGAPKVVIDNLWTPITGTV
jgi:hypothetical protein